MSERKIHLSCKSCGQINRILVEKMADTPKCGACKAALTPDKPQEVKDEAAFKKVALEGDLPVLVDFWAPWCGPCRMVAPTLEKIATQFQGKVQVAKVNTDQAQDLARRHNISGIPTLILFRGGQEVDRVTGALPAPQLVSFVQRHAAAVG